jgi:hypothetical protein
VSDDVRLDVVRQLLAAGLGLCDPPADATRAEVAVAASSRQRAGQAAAQAMQDAGWLPRPLTLLDLDHLRFTSLRDDLRRRALALDEVADLLGPRWPSQMPLVDRLKSLPQHDAREVAGILLAAGFAEFADWLPPPEDPDAT